LGVSDARALALPSGVLDDTMFDLMMDGLGGLVGGVLGPLYIWYSRRSRALVRSFRNLLEGRRQVG
jgi:hypothetical protein